MARKKQDQMLPTPSSATGLPAIPAGGAGLERLGPEDFIIPRLMLVQPTSQLDGVEVGTSYLNLTGEQFAEIEVVFLRVSKGRVHFADANERNPSCGSADGIMPLPRFEPPMAPTCAECACSRCNGKEPPPCNETYNLLGVMLETGLPFWWSVKSTAIAPTRRLLSSIALRARMGKHLFDAQVTMKSQLVTLPGKKYYVPLYAATWLKDSSRYRDLYAQHVHEEIERTFMAEEETSPETIDPQGFDWSTGQQVR
jgi:hypothetical protein